MADTLKSRAEDALLSAFARSLGSDRLTVLTYHRVRSVDGFPFFEPVVNATPEGFAMQMDFIADHFNAISLEMLHSWLDGRIKLPPRPALITFDDGYRDNLENALPILEERSLPAVLFLATDHIGTATPFFWDTAAYCFETTSTRQADLPLLGHRSWDQATPIATEWIQAVKKEPDELRPGLLDDLAVALAVEIPDDVYAGQLLTWDEVRVMASSGFEMASHTLTHPILTQLSTDEVERQLRDSRQRIEDELGIGTQSLAYPNGMATDFDPRIMQIAENAGYKTAFTLLPGPARARDVRANPLAIRRISPLLIDNARRYRAKLNGGGRLKKSLS